MAAKEEEGELTLKDIYGVPHPINSSVYRTMLGYGWTAFALSIVCNLLFYAVHPAKVQIFGVSGKIPNMPWKKRKDEENPELENDEVPVHPIKVQLGRVGDQVSKMPVDLLMEEEKSDEQMMETDQNEENKYNEKKVEDENSEEEEERSSMDGNRDKKMVEELNIEVGSKDKDNNGEEKNYQKDKHGKKGKE